MTHKYQESGWGALPMRLLSSSTKPGEMLLISTFAANSYCPLHLSVLYFFQGVNTGIPALHKRQPETGLD